MNIYSSGHSQANTLLPFSYSIVDSNSELLYLQNLTCLLSQENYGLNQQIQMLKASLKEKDEEIKLIKQQEVMPVKEKKIYKKHLECPMKLCHRRYSSKIALNKHIRVGHNGKSEDEMDSK
jgi:hypothetical protein